MIKPMDDDYYIYNEKALCLVGERTKKTYRIGDKVKVQLIKVSIEARQIDFILIDENENGNGRSKHKEPELIEKGKKKDKDREKLLKHIGAKPKRKKNKH